jgi:hypothetical protein
VLTDAELLRASTIKVRHVQQLLRIKGVQGVGIGASSDRPGEAALVIFTVRGVNHDAIPAVLDGVRTKLRESGRFRLGSGTSGSGSGGCKALAASGSANSHK